MTPATVSTVPNQPKTPMRSLRVSDEQWQLWQQAAEAEGQTLSDYLRAVMDRSAKRSLRRAGQPYDTAARRLTTRDAASGA